MNKERIIRAMEKLAEAQVLLYSQLEGTENFKYIEDLQRLRYDLTYISDIFTEEEMHKIP
jgi:hypothetical protein